MKSFRFFIIALAFAAFGCAGQIPLGPVAIRSPLVVRPKTATAAKLNKPIARLVLCEPTHASATNPNGWLYDLFDADPTVGWEMLGTMAIARAQDMGAGTILIWDLPGGPLMRQFNSDVDRNGYLGSPDLVPAMHPEMTAPLRHMHARFKAAGLRVGGCLRPHELNLTTGKLVDSFDCYTTLARKAAVAHAIWGWDTFYVDTNYDHVNGGNLLPASIFRRLYDAFPTFRWITEAEDASYYSTPGVNPYVALENGETGTPDDIRAANPKAAAVIEVNVGDFTGNRAKLVQSVRRGDAILTDVLGDPQRPKDVAGIYAAAGAN